MSPIESARMSSALSFSKEVNTPHTVEKCATVSRNICKDVPTQVARQECYLVPREECEQVEPWQNLVLY